MCCYLMRLIVAISNWWDGRKDSSGPKYIHPDDIRSEHEMAKLREQEEQVKS